MRVYAWLIDWFNLPSEKLSHGDDFRVGPKRWPNTAGQYSGMKHTWMSLLSYKIDKMVGKKYDGKRECSWAAWWLTRKSASHGVLGLRSCHRSRSWRGLAIPAAGFGHPRRSHDFDWWCSTDQCLDARMADCVRGFRIWAGTFEGRRPERWSDGPCRCRKWAWSLFPSCNGRGSRSVRRSSLDPLDLPT